MKVCKIILIILLVIKVVINIFRTLAADGNDQFAYAIATLLHAIFFTLLYIGAGIFDL